MIDAITYTEIIARLMQQVKTSDEVLIIFLYALKDPKIAPRFPERYSSSDVNNSGFWQEGLINAIAAAAERLLPEERKHPRIKTVEVPDTGTIWRTPQGDTLIVVGHSQLGIVYCCPWTEGYFRMDFLQCLAVTDFAKLRSLNLGKRSK